MPPASLARSRTAVGVGRTTVGVQILPDVQAIELFTGDSSIPVHVTQRELLPTIGVAARAAEEVFAAPRTGPSRSIAADEEALSCRVDEEPVRSVEPFGELGEAVSVDVETRICVRSIEPGWGSH